MKPPDRILTLADANELESLRAERDAVVRTAKDAVAAARARALRDVARVAGKRRRELVVAMEGHQTDYMSGRLDEAGTIYRVLLKLAREAERKAAK